MLLALITAACSNQWRESDPGVDGDQAMALLSEIAAGGQQRSFTVNALNDLVGDPYSTIYFAESNAAMGPVPRIFSFSDTSFLGTLWGAPITIGTNVFHLDLNYVGVIFLDARTAQGARYFTLMMKFMTPQVPEPEYFIAQSAPNDYYMDDKRFETRLPMRDGTVLILRSFDLDKDLADELAPTIQLKAYILDGGIEYDIGQFSVLHGFGGAF